MYQNAALMQHLSDAKMADLRRVERERDPRTADVRHNLSLRNARPLLGWRRNH
jgi:hypothetical protein